ncbi:hypothetical protein P152DRAFT_322434 [Eremomyces bilateralis CBS 781.70]|uniref:Amino acid transporter transmembrane domain-containing protein n=1 Tax=Eremomyces bilateralis CBS 781.70 TaxID=1392243 RepID=A0A6G1G656_9PEZI|nr:uncharacterized protein P152DRAFT_322434 [Eremomyces bilateralis CBS 781.70]KAF1813502.1 hypothetical protein P152DRAFT_322434 [Eremomyces bilateralis CBS 781.70]
MPSPGKQPTTWGQYEHGSRSGSVGSTGSHVQWAVDARDEEGGHQLFPRISNLRSAGGVNSIDNFARSWTRAAAFHQITPARPSFRFQSDTHPDGTTAGEFPEGFYEDDSQAGLDSPSGYDGDQSAIGSPNSRGGFMRPDMDPRNTSDPFRDTAIATSTDESGTPDHDLDQGVTARLLQHRRASFRSDSGPLSIEPSIGSQFGGSYGTMYGSVGSRRNSTMRHAARLWEERQREGERVALGEGVTLDKDFIPGDDEGASLIIREVEEDGVKYTAVVGQSTLPQTIFNSVNVLIGVGLLSLPLALKYCGWVLGMSFFLAAVLVTQHTAKLLAKCLDVDSSLVTFADLAYVSFGSRARIAVSVLFSVELIAACVALVILFADSLDALIPGLSLVTWKIICGIILIPLVFLPLRLLSFTSVLGIICCFGITISVLADGFIKEEQPGSLLSPATTYAWPEHWGTLLLGFGLLMSPWGGHSVFPNIYRDMRHPHKYHRAVNITYVFTYLLDLLMAVVGLLMFGDGVREEITSNILMTPGYPQWISIFIVICVAIIPLTKAPLNARPVLSTLEVIIGLHISQDPGPQNPHATTRLPLATRQFFRILLTIALIVIFVFLAIVFPAFDRIMALLGSVCCFSGCIILPLAFHLKLFYKDMGPGERLYGWVCMSISTLLAIASTIAAILPRDVVGY